jgi:hypothetical protein
MKFQFECLMGGLEVYDDYVILKRKTIPGISGTDVQQTIYFKDIISVQFKNCGWTQGVIDFDYPGSIDGKFIFGAPTIGKAKALAIQIVPINEFIQRRVSECREQANQNQTMIIQEKSAADEIMKFKTLLDQGIISQEEFNIKKNQLLTL